MAKHWKKDELIAAIAETFPEGRVVPRHNEKGHFYEVNDGLFVTPPIYPSVTGKLQILKDEGLINYKMNRAIESLKNWSFGLTAVPDMEMITTACELASRASQDILEDAGDIGTRVHNARERIFEEWKKTGVRPVDFLSFVSAEEYDIRVVSCLRALDLFCKDTGYEPVAIELLVYNHQFKTAGTLDDLGLMTKVMRPGNPECNHEQASLFGGTSPTQMMDDKGIIRCLNCDYKAKKKFVLMDLKTSNQFKDHYFFQVAVYWWMFTRLMGKRFRPEECFILKLSKEDGLYKIEDLKKPAKLAEYARAMMKTNEGMEFIKSLRKDNQKVVLKL